MLRYFDGWIFWMVHSIGPINVCVCANFEINRYKIYEFRNMQIN